MSNNNTWCPIPMNKDILNNMKYDGNAIQRHKRIKKFLPLFYDSVIIAAAQSKTKYIYSGKEFHSDVFTLNDKKIKDDLIPILHFLFPNCSIYYSETNDIGGNPINKSICVDWT